MGCWLWVVGCRLRHIALIRTISYRLIERLTIYLTNALGASHHVSWVDSFICRNHDKLLSAILHREVCYHARTIYIILHSHGWIIFHHRHMLVSGSMEHIFGSILTENLLHLCLIAYRAHDGRSDHFWIIVHHIEANIVHRCLSLIDKNQFGRRKSSHLTSHFRADRAGSTSDKDTFSSEHGSNSLHIDLNLFAWQEVFDIHFVQLPVTKT